ncbi:MAG: AgmX/PglI C-terminal domain-containing protein [Myxococcales bacterium]
MNVRTLLLSFLLSSVALAQGSAPVVPPAPQPKPDAAPQEKQGPDLTGMPFDRLAVQTVVQHHMPEIQECYEGVLADTGQRIEGRVSVGFIVDSEGMVSQARALPKKSTMKDPRVVECVLSSVRRWRFPRPGDNRDHPIEYPFDLKVVK